MTGVEGERNLILVVDDEATILRVASMVLAAEGFRVAIAENGREGLSVYEDRSADICLVLVDVEMPEMNGLEMAERILEDGLPVKFLFMSGYSDRILELQARRRYPFIRKPFLPADLVRKVAEVLGGAAAAK